MNESHVGWTSLKIVELVVSGMTPIAVVVLGVYFARTAAKRATGAYPGSCITPSPDRALPFLPR